LAPLFLNDRNPGAIRGFVVFAGVFEGVLERVGGRRWFLVVNKRYRVWIVWSVDCTFSQAENVPHFGNKSVEIWVGR
jgi:hypothetical protein